MKQISFKSEAAKRTFCTEWKRRTGEQFRARRIHGENHGYVLRDEDDQRRANEIEQANPGTLL